MADNLTRDEARLRSELISVGSYRVELDVTGGEATFRSVSKVLFDCARPGAGTFINLVAPEVHAITLNGAPVSLDAFDGERIALTGLAAGNELVVDAECAYSRSGEGLHRFVACLDRAPVQGRGYLQHCDLLRRCRVVAQRYFAAHAQSMLFWLDLQVEVIVCDRESFPVE